MKIFLEFKAFSAENEGMKTFSFSKLTLSLFSLVFTLSLFSCEFFTSSIFKTLARDNTSIFNTMTLEELIEISKNTEVNCTPETSAQILKCVSNHSREEIKSLSLNDKVAVINLGVSAILPNNVLVSALKEMGEVYGTVNKNSELTQIEKVKQCAEAFFTSAIKNGNGASDFALNCVVESLSEYSDPAIQKTTLMLADCALTVSAVLMSGVTFNEDLIASLAQNYAFHEEIKDVTFLDIARNILLLGRTGEEYPDYDETVSLSSALSAVAGMLSDEYYITELLGLYSFD